MHPGERLTADGIRDPATIAVVRAFAERSFGR